MLYTIIPEEIVLQGMNEIAACKELTYRGKRLLVQPLEDNKYQVVQLISSDPADFLSPEFAPGMIISK